MANVQLYYYKKYDTIINKYLALSGGVRLEGIESLIIKKNNKEKQYMTAISENFFHIIEHTLKVNDIIDWEKNLSRSEFPPFEYKEEYPKKQMPKKKNFIFDLLDIGKISELERINKRYTEDCRKYLNDKKSALKNYLKQKREFDLRKDKYNTDLEYLKYYYERSEKSAVEKYCCMVLDASEYPTGLEHKYRIKYNYISEAVFVDILLPSIKSFSKIKDLKNNSAESPDIYEDEEFKKMYEKIIISIGIRTIHELYEANYNSKINRIVLNAFVLRDYMEYTVQNPDFTQYSRCLFGFKTEKDDFMKLELRDEDVFNIADKMNIVRIKNFNDAGEVMAPVVLRQE